MGQAQRLGEGQWVLRGSGLGERGEDRGVRAASVIGLRGQPGPYPQRQRGLPAEQGKRVLEPCLKHRRTGDRPALADPQAGQLSQPLGVSERLPARQQVAGSAERALTFREADPELIGQAGHLSQPDPLGHPRNVLTAFHAVKT
jgi:hypothetical protein